MSLIITYIGSKGCVMAADKRRIGFYGAEVSRENLEAKLYSGSINTKEELLKEAEEFGVKINISDDADKIYEIEDVIVGEVRSKTVFETKRKRIYATTGAYNIVELLGSNLETVKSGGSSIIVFGNKYTKELAEKSIKKYWKSKLNLVTVKKIFENVMEEVAIKTPTVSMEYNIIMKYPSLDIKEAKELLRKTIVQDIKDLENYRTQLSENLIETSKNIQMATRIVIQGAIGNVAYVKGKEVGIILDKGIEALDTDWNIIIKSSELIKMTVEDGSKVSRGDLVVIENENLCINRTKELLNCEFILWRAEPE